MTLQTKLSFLLLFFIGSIHFSCTESTPSETAEASTTTEEVIMEEKPASEKVLRHVVVFKYKEESTEADVEKITEAFKALQDSIPQIKDFEWGLNNSPEGLDQDFTHCYLLTFESEEDRAIYLPHPAHVAFGELLKPHLEKVFVVDYWTTP